MIILLVIAAIAVSAPVVGVVLVSLASHREDAAHSLAGRPSGPVQAAARRLLGFHGDGLGRHPAGRPEARSRRQAPSGFQGDSGFLGDSGISSDGFLGDSGYWGDGTFPADAARLADRPDVPHLVA
jgi:hypothetical protein